MKTVRVELEVILSYDVIVPEDAEPEYIEAVVQGVSAAVLAEVHGYNPHGIKFDVAPGLVSTYVGEELVSHGDFK